MTETENLSLTSGTTDSVVQGMAPAPTDRVTIAPNVLLTMIRMAALCIKGVAHMGNTPGGVNAWLRRTPSERGVQVVIENDLVSIDVYIVVNADSNLREVSQAVQKQIARDIDENLGMQVGAVNIHIEDVVFDQAD
jgi:uncharacterized alkaline shock family protein YloU